MAMERRVAPLEGAMQRSTETMEQLGEALRQLEARRQATQVTIQEL
jgi:hypothetical protein